MPNAEEYLTVTEARKLMVVSENKIAAMIKSGELPTIPNPRNKSSKLIPRSAVEAWLEKASVRPPAPRKKPPSSETEANKEWPAAQKKPDSGKRLPARLSSTEGALARAV